MTTKLHNILCVTLFAAGTLGVQPLMAETPTQAAAEMVAPESKPVEVVAAGSNVRVKNAEGSIIEVFSITGEKMMTQRVESPSVSFDLGHLPKGLYIIKVGSKTTIKVYLK